MGQASWEPGADPEREAALPLADLDREPPVLGGIDAEQRFAGTPDSTPSP